MNDFKPDNQLKPDASDRRLQRKQCNSRIFTKQLPISRQKLMIPIGIVVLFLLIIGVGGALQSPSKPSERAQTVLADNDKKSIDLSYNDLKKNKVSSKGSVSSGNDLILENAVSSEKSKILNTPLISDYPIQRQVMSQPIGQDRIKLSDSTTDTLSKQKNDTANLSEPVTSTLSAKELLPLSEKERQEKSAYAKNIQNSDLQKKLVLNSMPKLLIESKKSSYSKNKAEVSKEWKWIKNAPSNHFTLQLSSASRSDTLKSYIKQHKLSNAFVYSTKRDGKHWYVLVNGVYASTAQAKQAVKLLPASLQAQKPWVKPIYQVQQDLNK